MTKFQLRNYTIAAPFCLIFRIVTLRNYLVERAVTSRVINSESLTICVYHINEILYKVDCKTSRQISACIEHEKLYGDR